MNLHILWLMQTTFSNEFIILLFHQAAPPSNIGHSALLPKSIKSVFSPTSIPTLSKLPYVESLLSCSAQTHILFLPIETQKCVIIRSLTIVCIIPTKQVHPNSKRPSGSMAKLLTHPHLKLKMLPQFVANTSSHVHLCWRDNKIGWLFVLYVPPSSVLCGSSVTDARM